MDSSAVPQPAKVEVGNYAERLHNLENQVSLLKSELEAQREKKSVSIVCFSGEWDRLFAAFSIANGALSMGCEVHMFFTFWAVCALRKAGHFKPAGKSFTQKLLGRMLPCGAKNVPLSKMNFGGMGKAMLQKLMKEKGVDNLDDLLAQARELGAHFYLCDTSFELFGLNCQELVDGEKLERCGVATFLSYAMRSKVSLFI
ncbi:MAG: DsrE/DsrF/DrsH-like family protein [bacterium]